MQRILHIAPANIANVPFTLMQAERELGFASRLVTLAQNPFGFPEDICLDLPFLGIRGLKQIKRLVSDPARQKIDNVHHIPESIPRQWHANGLFEKSLIRLREFFWHGKIAGAVATLDLGTVDVVQLDGGLGFYRDARIITDLKSRGKKIICCYTGSDLRTRGVIPQIDAISDLNVSVEYDHLFFHPSIHHVFFPFAAQSMPPAQASRSATIRIGHAPTNRRAKGTDAILAALDRLGAARAIDVVLIENKPYAEALALKAGCDLFIDQIGDLGYGVNALEALSMGIPVATSLVKGFADRYPDHPFIVVDGDSLAAKLAPYLDDGDARAERGRRGKAWVEHHHDPMRVVRRIHKLAGLKPAKAEEKG